MTDDNKTFEVNTDELVTVKGLLEEMARERLRFFLTPGVVPIYTEYDASGQTCFINPRWRVTTDAGANIWGTFSTWEDANDAYALAVRYGHKSVGQVMLGIAVVEFDDDRFLLIHSDDGTPILTAEVGDGKTFKFLIAQYSLSDSATDFQRWAQLHAQRQCLDLSIVVA